MGPGESVVSVDIVGSGVFLWEIMCPDKPDGTLMLVDPPPGGGDKGGEADGAEPDVGSTRFSTSSGCPGRNYCQQNSGRLFKIKAHVER